MYEGLQSTQAAKAPPPAEQVPVDRGDVRDPANELVPKGLKRLPMVRWYDPGNLLRTAKEVFLANLIGKYADQRRSASGDTHRPRYFDYTQHEARDERGGLWIDYVADTGDGWDPTFTVARGVGNPKLAVGGLPGSNDPTVLPRASILVLGGDEVYPVGSRRSYDERLVAPYAAAVRDLADGDPHPDVYAIPGNHDWYDSLVAFSRRFAANRWFAHWRTRQNRSYFALKLPGGWWLLGTDVQLGSDIDGEQLEYFEFIANKCMNPDDRVILCHAEPHWIVEAITGDRDRYHSYNLKDLEERVLRDRTWIYLAGDLHHYRRHTCRDGRQRIVAGGGGAFMHPTHTNLGRLAKITEDVTDERGDRTERVYELVKDRCFPPPDRSRRVVLRNLLPFGVLWRQWWFAVVPALLYMLTAWMVYVPLVAKDHQVIDLASALNLIGDKLIHNPGAAIWTLLIGAGFYMLTPMRRRICRLAAGLTHAVAHMSGVLLCAYLTAHLTATFAQDRVGTFLLQGLVIAAMGGVIGAMIFGWYLTFMCEVFGVHENDATATQASKHWKSFLRLRIGGDGSLAIHPIGIAKTPSWRRRRNGLVPKDGREDHQIYRYIEPPIVIPPRTA